METIKSITMPLQATSNLNLSVTKEDLMEILIDEQLTMLEKAQEDNRAEYKIWADKATKLRAKKKKDFDVKLKKLIPNGLNRMDCTNISYSPGHPQAQIIFMFPGFNVTLLQNQSTVMSYSQKELDSLGQWDKTMQIINTDWQTIQQKIQTLNGNNKRLKAKMIKSFLTKTNEGKSILNTLGSTPKEMLQLTA